MPFRSRIAMPGGPDDMDFAPDGKIWVTRRWAHTVALLDPATGQFTTLETGRSPHGIWLNTHPVAPTKVRAVTAKGERALGMDPFDTAAGWLQEHLVIPVLYQLDLMQWEDVGYGWALFAIYGVAQVLITLAVCLPLERWRPVESWPDAKAVTVDVFYTLLNRIGVLPLVTFVLFYQIQVGLNGWLTDHGIVPPTLEMLLPGLLGHQVLTFALYVLILDCGEYWRHRLSHSFGWWWALHSLHHAQRQMTFWSDDRNHVVDEVICFLWSAAIALLIGIPPLQFPLLVLVLRFLESLSHANARVSFGQVGDRLLISPRFHRAHHGVLAAGQRELQLRLDPAGVGHAVRHGGFRARIRADRRPLGRGSAGDGHLVAAATRRVAADGADGSAQTCGAGIAALTTWPCRRAVVSEICCHQAIIAMCSRLFTAWEICPRGKPLHITFLQPIVECETGNRHQATSKLQQKWKIAGTRMVRSR